MVTASQDPNALVIRPEQAARDPNEMSAEEVEEAQMSGKPQTSSYYLQEFKLYQTQSKFYMIGRDKSKTIWRVLKIDRSEPSELNIQEDSTTYSESECKELLKHIDEGNQITGGLKFVTRCFGIVGFIKFLGPYYMLLITERRQIGSICGHTIYAITRSKMIAIQNSSILSSLVNPKDEIRYKKLLCTMDLTKDFFFSYSYHIMHSLQKNVCHNQTGKTMMHETMFVWNEFLTRDIQNLVQNTLWTVALVYGFFKQEKLSVSGKDFNLTLIGRRSRHYAGTRYLKRGVNEKGRVANDVETEQIVFEEISGGVPTNISSVVQNRGSIPLFWSQETSKLNLKPDIVLHKKDKDYEATRLHFENISKRYGHPVIILNLIKSEEKRMRESILRSEFAQAIQFINKDLCEESKLKFLHWDLHKHSRSNAKAVLTWLGLMATNILNITGFFHCEVTPVVSNEDPVRWPVIEVHDAAYLSSTEQKNDNGNNTNNTDDSDMSEDLSQEDNTMCSNEQQHEIMEIAFNNSVKPLRLQNGVLRTNCIDCLDRTNVAQYSFGLAALEQQLHALNLISIPRIDLDDPIADDLMKFYETMGDTLALQYGGSAAHNKIFSQRRGQWRATTQSQEFFRTLQRYYNNAYMDAEKQAAINLFLGYFQPQEGKPAIWELDPDQHCNLGKTNFADENPRSLVKRSLSDGNILHESNTSLPDHGDNQKRHVNGLSDSTPNISTCPNDVLFIRSTPAMSRRHFFGDTEFSYFYESGDSNFLDLDSLSSSGNSCDEEVSDRSTALSTPSENLSTENVIGVGSAESTSTAFENASSLNGEHPEMPMTYDATQKTILLKEFSDRFVHWVLHGETMSDLNC